MFKFILLTYVVIFSASFKTFAQNDIPKPTSWAENDLNENESPEHYFYKKTRLECVRRAIQTDDIAPSTKYLAAISLKVRNDIVLDGVKKESLFTLGEENYDYRYVYLNTVARYISTYGVCLNENKEKSIVGIEGFKKGEAKGKYRDKGETELAATFIETSETSTRVFLQNANKSVLLNNNTVAEMITGKDYDSINKLFPNVIDGKSHYRFLSQDQRRKLVEQGIKNGKVESFSHCLSSIEEYQEQKDLKEKSKQLCQKIMTSCGYPTRDCGEESIITDKTKTAPPQIVPTEKGRTKGGPR